MNKTLLVIGFAFLFVGLILAPTVTCNNIDTIQDEKPEEAPKEEYKEEETEEETDEETEEEKIPESGNAKYWPAVRIYGGLDTGDNGYFRYKGFYFIYSDLNFRGKTQANGLIIEKILFGRFQDPLYIVEGWTSIDMRIDFFIGIIDKYTQGGKVYYGIVGNAYNLYLEET
jgi:hypothetical protein